MARAAPYHPAPVSLRSTFLDGSTRGRTIGSVRALAVADDGRSAIFVGELPGARMVGARMSLDDGEVTVLGALPGTQDHRLATRPAAAFGFEAARSRVERLDLATGAVTTTPTPGRSGLLACSLDGRHLALYRPPEGPRAAGAADIVRVGDGALVASVAACAVAAFSGDGRFALLIDDSDNVRFVDLGDGRGDAFARARATNGHAHFHPERDGARVLHVDHRGALTLFNPETRKVAPLGAWGRGLRVLGFSAGRALLDAKVDGRRCAALLDVSTGAMTPLPIHSEWRAALAPDGSSVVYVRERCLERLDVAGAAVSSWHDGHDGPAALAWSRDGARLATRGAHGAVRVLAPAAGALAWTLEGPRGEAAVCFSADGRTLYASAPRQFVAWDLGTGAAAVSSARLTQRTASMATSDDGRRLALVGHNHTLRLLDVSGVPRRAGSFTGALREPYNVAFDGPALVRCLCRAADATPWAIRQGTAGYAARWFDLEGREVEAVALPGGVGAFLGVDGEPDAFLAANGGAIVEARRAEPSLREVRGGFDRPRLLCAGAGVVVCEVGPADGRALVVLARDDGRELERVASHRGFHAARVCPDGLRLAVAYADGGVEVFALPTAGP